MIDLYDEEVVRIHHVAFDLTRKWSHREATKGNLELLEREAVSRLADIGFIATVDTIPCLLGQPPSITIVDRVEPHIFDHEKKEWEVRKAHEKSEDIHDEGRRPE